MKIGSIGSCLANMTVSHILSKFGGKRVFHVYRHRSDQFYYYNIKKDRSIIPRDYIENNLKPSTTISKDPNYIPSTEMLDNQYDKIGQHCVASNNDFFDSLKNEQLDIIILDNYIDMGAQLSYPKVEGYDNSPVFLRTGDYENYKDFFTLGEKISIKDSAFYFKQIILHLRALQPKAIIYFLHYPYNTYINNPKRQTRAKTFEQYFESDEVTIVPAPIIKQAFQKDNDPAHFDDSIYVAYAGFIAFDYMTKLKKKEKRKLTNEPYWIDIKVEPGKTVSISGYTQSSSDENTNAALTIFDFGENEPDEEIYKAIGLVKSPVGIYKYLPIKELITEWSFNILIPEEVHILRIGFRTWKNKYDVFLYEDIDIVTK